MHITVNKVGPFSNPHETYRYYSLPFCRGPSGGSSSGGEDDNNKENDKQQRGDERRGEMHKKHKVKLGEALAGDRKETSPYDVTFRDDVQWRQLCQVSLSPGQVRKFKDAVHEDYYFEVYIEDMPMWGYVGEVRGEDLILGERDGSGTYLFPHLHFKIGYNGNKIVSAKVFTQSHRKVDITDSSTGADVTFSYSVEWVSDDLPHSDRMSRYVDSAFLPSSLEIHWLSVINSFVLVLLLTTFLSVILMRVLKNDFSRYMDAEDEEGGALVRDEEETGWKLIHGDVFRFPKRKAIFASCQGAGCHLLAAAFTLIVFALIGVTSTTRRGSILTSIIFIYTFTSFVGGFVSARLYRQIQGDMWARNIVLTCLLFPLPMLMIFSWVNSVAWSRSSTSALPAVTVIIVLCLFFFVSVPLTIVGGVIGRKSTEGFDAPTRTKKLPREIPRDGPWYRHAAPQVLLSGFLPFSAIYIELHYIFASVWGHRIYTLFGILLLAFVMLTIVTSFVTVSVVYHQLAGEDHRWWWRSFFNGGSAGPFIYAYSFYYYHQKSDMGGLLQGSFFFGYMAVISFAASLMLGSVGFWSSCWFVKYIYSRVKCD